MSQNTTFGLRDIHKDPISGDEDHLAYLKQKLESCKYDFEEAYLYSDRKNQTLPQRTYKTNLGEALRPQWGAGIWPPMREVLQNAIDHLSLTNKHGLRHQHVKTDFAESADGVKVLHFYIECASEPEYHVSLLKISFVGEDKIRFWQSHTYPLHPNTLVKGMRDMLKENNNSQVGGFGYGMKDMFREILHRDESSVTYRMWGNDKEYAEWNVKTEPPSLRSRRFHVDRHLVIHTNCKNKGKTVKERNVLEIEVKLPGIVSKFKEEVFKCCALFWDTSLREKWISAADGSGSDGSWVCLCKDIKFDPNVSKMVGLEVLPAPFKGLYNSGLFVTQNDHPFESKTVLVFGWGSKARPQTTARSHLNREVVQKELGRIVTHPASDEERDRAKDCLSYLISGKPEGADSKLLWTKQVGWWENSLQTKDLYRLLGYDPKTLFVCKPDGPLSEWALKMANVLAIHTKPQYFEKYANPAFQCLENPKSANIELFPQMNDKELMQKVYDMIDKEAEFLEDLREIDCTEIYISNFEPTQVTLVISYPPPLLGSSEPRLSTMVESAAVKMLCLATLWMRKRVRRVLDMDRNPVNLGLPRTKKILHICCPHAEEGMAFYVDGSVLVVVTPLLEERLQTIKIDTMREMLMTLVLHESVMCRKALGHAMMAFGHMYHKRTENHSDITKKDVQLWFNSSVASICHLLGITNTERDQIMEDFVAEGRLVEVEGVEVDNAGGDGAGPEASVDGGAADGEESEPPPAHQEEGGGAGGAGEMPPPFLQPRSQSDSCRVRSCGPSRR